MVNRFEKFSFVIYEINRSMKKIQEDEMRRYDLKGAYARYLLMLRRYPEGLTASQLCELCDRNKADVSRAMSSMENKGLVFRHGKSPAGYRARMYLSEEGKHAADQVRDRAATAVELGGKGLSDEDRITFYNVLDLIASNLRDMSKDGIPTDSMGKIRMGIDDISP